MSPMPRPTRLPAEQLADHIDDLCDQFDIIKLSLTQKEPKGGSAGHLTFSGSPPESFPFIWVPRIRGPVSYYVALHEIGHHRTKSAHQLVREINAWDWAFNHALIDPSASVLRGVRKRLSTYRQPDDAHEWLDMLDKEILRMEAN